MKVFNAEKVDYYYLLFSNSVLDWNCKWTLCNYLTASKIVTEITRDGWFGICDKNDNKLHLRNMHIKYKIIFIVQHTIAEYVPFVVQYHKVYNKININHSPYWFWL